MTASFVEQSRVAEAAIPAIAMIVSDTEMLESLGGFHFLPRILLTKTHEDTVVDPLFDCLGARVIHGELKPVEVHAKHSAWDRTIFFPS